MSLNKPIRVQRLQVFNWRNRILFGFPGLQAGGPQLGPSAHGKRPRRPPALGHDTLTGLRRTEQVPLNFSGIRQRRRFTPPATAPYTVVDDSGAVGGAIHGDAAAACLPLNQWDRYARGF